MPTASDTSPLFNLAAVGLLPLLSTQFPSVLVPPEVIRELEPVQATPAGVAIAAAKREGRLLIQEVENRALVRSLSLGLDLGEAAAIALAIETRASTVLLDEAEARRVARQLGLRPLGVLGILLRAKREGRLQSVHAAMRELRTEAGFFIAPALFAEVLSLAGER